MIYIEDTNKKYEDDIIKHLRTHNNQFVGDREIAECYFYALIENELVGALHTNLFWDWVALKDMFYNNSNVLSTILDQVTEHYHNKAVGIKCFTHSNSREKDLLAIGFIIGGHTVKTNHIPAYTFLKSVDSNFESNEDIEIIVSEEKIDKYEVILNREKIQEPDSKWTHVYYVALEDDEFAGGIHGIIEEDSMYISRLAVNPKYRKHGIGSKLMKMAEDKANELNLYNMTTGTCSFQAKDFYVKLGYDITLTKENDPKGYDSYSLEKRLKK